MFIPIALTVEHPPLPFSSCLLTPPGTMLRDCFPRPCETVYWPFTVLPLFTALFLRALPWLVSLEAFCLLQTAPSILTYHPHPIWHCVGFYFALV